MSSTAPTTDDLFHPSLAAALMKLDPDDGAQVLDYFKTHALLAREKALLQASVREQKKLLVENGKLKKDIEQLRVQLQDKQRRRSAKALLSAAPPPERVSPAPEAPADGAAAAPPPSSERRPEAHRRGRRDRKARPCPPLLGAEPAVDISVLELRVGRVLSARRHPLAAALCVQQVDLGEGWARSVVGKLGGDAQLEEVEGALCVLLCNAKARKVRGVLSQARLLCCVGSDGETELLAPPPGSAPGDRVTFLSYPGEAERELAPRLRLWEQLRGDLRVDQRGVANYKGCGFEVKGKGLCRAPTLTNCSIR